jgi:hypothetical protein
MNTFREYITPFQPQIEAFFGKNASDSSIIFVAMYFAIHTLFLVYIFFIGNGDTVAPVHNLSKISISEDKPNVFDGKNSDEIHDMLASLSERKNMFVNWYDRDYTSYLVKHLITDEMWTELMTRRTEMEEYFDRVYYKWASNVLTDILYKKKFGFDISTTFEPFEDDDIIEDTTQTTDGYNSYENDPTKLLEETLLSFSNHTLVRFSGGAKGTKAELTKMVMNPILKNIETYKENKLRKLSKQLE